jgi:C4-type Zn-finger protein
MKKRSIKKIKNHRLCPKCKIGTLTKQYRKMKSHNFDLTFTDNGIGVVEYYIHCKRCGFLHTCMCYSSPYSIWDTPKLDWHF